MGEAHRFEREFIDHAIEGVESVFAEYDFVPTEEVRWPGWRTVIERWGDAPGCAPTMRSNASSRSAAASTRRHTSPMARRRVGP
jgi:hypothetical protein